MVIGCIIEDEIESGYLEKEHAYCEITVPIAWVSPTQQVVVPQWRFRKC